MRRGDAKALREAVLVRLEAEQQHAAAVRVVALHDVGDALPGGGVGRRRQLPPVGPDAGRVDLLERARQRVGACCHVARRHDLDQELAVGAEAGGLQGFQACQLFVTELGGILRVIDHQAFRDVLGRPLAQREREVGARLELQRARAGQLDRPRDPPCRAGQRRQHGLAVAVVDDDAEARIAAPGRGGRSAAPGAVGEQCLEAGDALDRHAGRELLELAAMVEREHRELRPVARAGRRAVQVLEVGVLAQPAGRGAVREEVLQLDLARHRRRAAVARDDQRAAGVRVGAAARERLVAQPAAQEAGHERIAGAEHVEDLDRKAGAGEAVVEALRDRAVEDDAAHRAALHHQGRGAQRAQRAQRRQRVARAAGDPDLFFGADDQVAVRNDLLELPADRRRFDVALLAEAGARQTPEHRPVVDVEHDPRRLSPCVRDGGFAGGERARLRQVRARQQQGARRADEGGVEVGRVDRHVGAAVAVEDQRKGVGVADAEEDQRGQPLRIGLHVRDVDAFGGQLLAHEAAVVLVADAGQHRRLQAEAGHADRGVGRRAAEVLRERAHVLEPTADLLAVQVDRGAPHADHVERPRRGGRDRGARRADCHCGFPRRRGLRVLRRARRDLVTGADDQRLREAERTDQRAERPGRVVAELEADVGGRLQRRQAAVGDRDHRDAALAAGERGLDHRRRVVAKARDEQRVAGADAVRELGQHAAEAVEQAGRQLELVERVGEVAGDRKRAALRQHVDLRRLDQHARGRLQRVGVDVVLELAQLADRLVDELVQHAAVGPRRRAAPAPHRLDALEVRRRALDQVALEHLLHLREAVEAERAREPDHRRRLHRVRLRDRGDGAEREVVRLVERVARQPLQLRRQGRVGARDRFLQLVVGGGAGGHSGRRRGRQERTNILVRSNNRTYISSCPLLCRECLPLLRAPASCRFRWSSCCSPW